VELISVESYRDNLESHLTGRTPYERYGPMPTAPPGVGVVVLGDVGSLDDAWAIRGR
jgi:hypothetical protein